MVVCRFICVFVLFVSLVSNAESQSLELTQQKVAEMVLKESFQSDEIQKTSDLSIYSVALAKSLYDWNFSLESYYENTQFQNFARTANPKDENYKTSVLVTKPLMSGTLLGLDISRTQIQSTFSATSTASFPANQTLDVAGITIEQSLLRNFFGRSFRAEVASAEKLDQSKRVLKTDLLQTLVLETVQLFWNAFVSQENFEEALNSRERTEKLAEVVRKKSSLGYTNPGELPQVLAELEVRNQTVKSESANYLGLLSQLKTKLRIPEATAVKLVTSTEIPELPQLSPTSIEDLRSIKSLKSKLESSDLSLVSSKSKAYPDLSLVGKYYTSGIGSTTTDSFQELSSQTRPKYYVGVKLAYRFGSDLQGQEIYNKKLQRDIDESTLSRTRLEMKDQIQNAERRMQSTYAIVSSSKKQVVLREEAAREIQKAYNQGRTDIKILIDVLNSFFAAEVQYSKAVGDYQIALNNLAALRDELIPEKGTLYENSL